jgi:uroporphyrinogen decarboxylase
MAMQTGRERVKATLTFSTPDRPPRDLWALPYVSLYRKSELDTLLEKYPVDIGGPQISPGSDEQDLARVRTAGSYTDEWGSVWHVGEPGVIGEVKAPILTDWSRLATFRPPWHTLQNRSADHVNRSCDRSTRFMISSACARPFERMQFLRGSEDLYVDIAENSQEFRALLEMVHEFYLKEIEWWARTHVDAVSLMDDWGSNESLLIRPAVWREIFKPLYKEYCDIIHHHGKFAFFHSDGHIEAIYPDLIEVGIDAVNSQLFCMDIEKLGRLYKGKITFWGEIDRQHVLPFGTPDDVRAAVRRVRSALDDGRGGVIAQCEWGKDNPARNVEAVFEAWR